MESIVAHIVGGTFLLGMGGLFGSFGVVVFLRGFEFEKQGCVASGIVVGCKQRRVDIASHSYFPEVEFRTAKGESIVFTASSGSSKVPALGRKVKVHYYLDDPHGAALASSANLWFAPYILLVFSMSSLGAAVFFFTGALTNPR
jgi:Protein of unknown function (DUF3592)